MLVEGANNEYVMIVSSNCWGPSGKLDNGNAPESLFTKAQVNSLVQCQVSAVLSTHHGENSRSKIDPLEQLKNITKAKETIEIVMSMIPCRQKKRCQESQKLLGKPNLHPLDQLKPKRLMAKPGIGVNHVRFCDFTIALQDSKIL